MKDELCAYEHDGLCMKGLAGTPCEIEGCVARRSEQNVLTNHVTKTSEQEEPTGDDLEEEIRMVAGDFEQVRVSWNSDFDFIARHFAEWGKKHAEIEIQSQSPASNDFEEEWSEYFRYKGSVATVNIKDLARHFANWQKQQMMKDAVKRVVQEGGMCPAMESIPVLTHTDMIQLPKDKFKVGDKVEVIIIKE